MATYADTAAITFPANNDPGLHVAARAALSLWEWGQWCPPYHLFQHNGQAWELVAQEGDNQWAARRSDADLRACAGAMGDNPYIDQAEYLRNFDRPDLAHYRAKVVHEETVRYGKYGPSTTLSVQKLVPLEDDK